MPGQSPTNPPDQENDPQESGCEAPFGLPRIPLHRFTFQTPQVGWGFLDTYHGLPAWGMHGWTMCYLILWDRAAHDDEWFAQNRGNIIWKYDDWEGPHYGDAVVLHSIHLRPGIRPENRVVSEDEVIRLALSHLKNPIPMDPPVTTWQSVQCYEVINSGIFLSYQALFLEPEKDRDLLRSACLLRSVEEPYDPPESIRLDLLELKDWQDCCVEVSVPREAFRKAYHEAVAGL